MSPETMASNSHSYSSDVEVNDGYDEKLPQLLGEKNVHTDDKCQM